MGPRSIAALSSALVLAAALGGAAARDAGGGEAVFLKRWALARCLAIAAKEGPFAEDAAATAGAYLEKSAAGIEAFEAMDGLAKAFLARTLAGEAPVAFDTMKCLDLYDSPELDGLVGRFAGR